MNKKLLLIFMAFCLFSCSKNEDQPLLPTEYAVKGNVEKGPFISGSTITLQPLDGKLNPLGISFPATITSDEGSFDFGSLKLNAPYALFTTNGYFFNEVDGYLSEAPITLQAIVDLSDNSTVNVNLLTHLKKERLKKLVAEGVSFADANKRVQKELLTNFGLQKYAATDVSRFTITAGTDEAAALILVSSALLKDRREAQLTEALAKLSQEFMVEGEFSETSKTDYAKRTKELQQDRIVQNIVERYKELGKVVTVKNLSYYIDWDNNGVAGDELGDPNAEIQLSFEQTALSVPMQGGTFEVKIKANVPYSFTDPSSDIPPNVFENEQLFKFTPISYTKNTENQHVLVMKFDPAPSILMKEESIRLYSMDGKVYSTLTISQKGDPSKMDNIWGKNGEEYILNSTYYPAMRSLNYMHTIDGFYTKSYQATNNDWLQYNKPPVKVSNPTLEATWRNVYASLRSVRLFMAAQHGTDKDASAFLIPYFACIEASLYYEMAVMWGNIIYAQGTDQEVLNSRQLNVQQLFPQLIEKLKPGVEAFPDKKNNFNKISDWLFVSKDTPRALMAKMYLYMGDHRKAYDLLRTIVDAGHYELEANRAAALSGNSRELIYSGLFEKVEYPFDMLEVGDKLMPLVTYTEVLLSLAECAYRLGNEAEANNFLNKVLAKRSIQPSGNFISSLQKTWASELKGTGTYFAFLKRNNLAMELLELKEYQLLLPIPERDVILNSNIIQNPYY